MHNTYLSLYVHNGNAQCPLVILNFVFYMNKQFQHSLLNSKVRIEDTGTDQSTDEDTCLNPACLARRIRSLTKRNKYTDKINRSISLFIFNDKIDEKGNV